jgi:cbb3-type cytochrome c oxidase subunit III
MRLAPGTVAAVLMAGVVACQGGVGGRPPKAGGGLIRASTAESSPEARPGISPEVVLGAVRNPYNGNSPAVTVGRQLFSGYNCAGCHSSYAGGGMGPNLRDSSWIYGGSDAQLFSSIAEGRPNGMPAWGGKVAEDQIWQIIAYLRTLGTGAEPVKPPTPSQGS